MEVVAAAPEEMTDKPAIEAVIVGCEGLSARLSLTPTTIKICFRRAHDQDGDGEHRRRQSCDICLSYS